MVRIGLSVAAAAAVLAGGAALVAFVVVPQFVRSSLDEAAPAAAQVATPSPSVSAVAPTPAPSVGGSLRRLDPAHYGTGRVTIGGPAGSRYLRFEGVDIAGAPNMFVYLSDREDGQPGHYADLGPLKATSGSFNYELPADLDLAPIRSVVVWCRAFSVTVTFATLERPAA